MKKKKGGGAYYYDYIAIKRNGRKDLYSLKLEIDFLLQIETSIHKLIPAIFSFMVARRERLVKEFIDWLKKENRIATISKHPAGEKDGQV